MARGRKSSVDDLFHPWLVSARHPRRRALCIFLATAMNLYVIRATHRRYRTRLEARNRRNFEAYFRFNLLVTCLFNPLVTRLVHRCRKLNQR
ncbi:hypothetical protein MESS2_760029 [Mesorhizobium metallidurans STM 2683]|uniref:Uncharacterized protein n=1 Tax=Mesorhizobium metallidurans STM 2683 TaxID=1297569 RepID=M5EW80_9HYPH|nr:hypothetical protein MESS2_760029 [Mesorhizobium metallidurans STM 2683]